MGVGGFPAHVVCISMSTVFELSCFCFVSIIVLSLITRDIAELLPSHLSQKQNSEMSSSTRGVEFVSGVLEKRYKCVKCHNVLQDPVQSSCGDR